MSLYLCIKSCNVFPQFRLFSGCSVLLSTRLLLLLLLQKFHLQSQVLILYTRIFQRRLRLSRFYFDTLHFRNNLQTTAVLIPLEKCNFVNFSFGVSSYVGLLNILLLPPNHCISDLGYFFHFLRVLLIWKSTQFDWYSKTYPLKCWRLLIFHETVIIISRLKFPVTLETNRNVHNPPF